MKTGNFDSFAGLVPVRLIRRYTENDCTCVELEVTRNHAAPGKPDCLVYKKSERIDTFARNFVKPVRRGIYIHCQTIPA